MEPGANPDPNPNPNPNQVHVSNATIAEWQQKYDAVMRALSDDEEEADMERLNAQARPSP